MFPATVFYIFIENWTIFKDKNCRLCAKREKKNFPFMHNLELNWQRIAQFRIKFSLKSAEANHIYIYKNWQNYCTLL
jgi:hypothetical protein